MVDRQRERTETDVPPADPLISRPRTPPADIAPKTAVPTKRSAQPLAALPHKKPAWGSSATPASRRIDEQERGELPVRLSTKSAAETNGGPVPRATAQETRTGLVSAASGDPVPDADTSGQQPVGDPFSDARAGTPDVTNAEPLPHHHGPVRAADDSETASPHSAVEEAADMAVSSAPAAQQAVTLEDDTRRRVPPQAGRRPATIPGATLTQGTTSESTGGFPFVPAMLAARPPVGNERRYVNFRVADHPPVYHPWQVDDSLSESGKSEDESTAASPCPEAAQPVRTRTPSPEPRAPEPSPPCGLCPQYDSGDMSPLPMIQVRLRRSFAASAKRVRIHRECAEWAPEVYWSNDDELVNVEKAYARGRRLRCVVCTTLGATIGCHVEACRRSFHLRCLKLGNCRVDDDAYAVFCEEHVDEAAPALYRSATGAWACRVQDE